MAVHAPSSRPPTTPLARFFPVLLFVVALLPRLAALRRYVTPDELIWVYRSQVFRQALVEGRWADTIVAGHPGVTTTWLGAAGMSVQMWFSAAARDAYAWLNKLAYLTPDNVDAFRRLAVLLDSGRLAVALANSLGVVLVYWLVKRLWGERVAVPAGLLLALDPFVAGLSGLLHVDGLSATLVILSFLSFAVAVVLSERQSWSPRAYVWLAFSGATAGLAALTKSPTLLLAPFFAALLPALLLLERDTPLSGRLKKLVWGGFVWGAALSLTLLIVFPALWAAPRAVYDTITGSANRHLEEALRPTFFMGQVAFDHGPLFYPVALLWRLSPVVLLALIPAASLLIERVGRRNKREGTLRPMWPAIALLVWAVLFVMMLATAAKKFDRYLLPIIPALIVAAAVVWLDWQQRLSGRWRRLVWLLVAAQAAYLVFFAGYPLAAYNPLVGGPWTAARLLPVGWGEGVSVGGRWLTENQPGAVNEAAISGIAPSLAPFFAGHTLVDGLDDPALADYVVLTLNGRQMNPDEFASRVAALEKLYTVRFGRLEQAWVFRRPGGAADSEEVSPLETPLIFGERIGLQGAKTGVVGELARLETIWQRLGPPVAGERFTVQARLRDEAGNVWGGQESGLLNETYFYPEHWPDGSTGVVRYDIELSPGMPPGRYRMEIALVNRDGDRLPIREEGGAFRGVVYPAGEIVVPPAAEPDAVTRLQIPRLIEQPWFDGALRLLGAGELPEQALAGGRLNLDLFWHAPGALPPGLQLDWGLEPVGDGAPIVLPLTALSRYDTGQWRPRETIHEKYRPSLPPETAPGRYRLTVRPILAGGDPAGAQAAIGELEVTNIERRFERPDDIAVPLDVTFGDELRLAGFTLEPQTAAAGEETTLTLIWEAMRQPDDIYTVFTHLINEEGEIVLQADHWPGGLPSDVLASGQIIVDETRLTLPSDLPPGRYELVVGLYKAEDGNRLPPAAGPLVRPGDDRVILPVVLSVP